MDFLNRRVQLFYGPQEQGAADNLEAIILRFIDEAEHSLELAVQELDNPRIAAALDLAARRLQPGSTRRLRVRLITEGDYLCEERPVEPPDAIVSLDVNRQLLTQLMRSAIDAKIDFNPKIFHKSSSSAMPSGPGPPSSPARPTSRTPTLIAT